MLLYNNVRPSSRCDVIIIYSNVMLVNSDRKYRLKIVYSGARLHTIHGVLVPNVQIDEDLYFKQGWSDFMQDNLVTA